MENEHLAQIRNTAWYSDPESLIYSRRMEKHLLEERFLHLLHTTSSQMQLRLSECRRDVMHAAGEQLRRSRQELQDTRMSMQRAVEKTQQKQMHNLSKSAGLLDAYSPLKVLSRGYSVVMKDQKAVTDAGQLNPGDRISVRMHKGMIEAAVTEVTGEETA